MKPTVPHENDIDAIREEAARWLIDLQSPDCRDFDGLNAWLDRSPEHRRVWEETRLMWQALGAAPLHYKRISAPRSPTADKASPSSPHARKKAIKGFARRMLVGGITSALLCFAALLVVPRLAIEWQADYLTTTAETRSIALEDGSTVQLGASSAIRTDFSGGYRRVTLLEGEAFFDVAHDEARPFIVDASEVRIEVLGTAFDVRLGEGQTDIGLARGSIRASVHSGKTTATQTLSAGNLLIVDRQTGKMSVDQVSADDIGVWRAGRLLVANSTIGEVVAEIQRYHPAWILMPDRGLAASRVTGVYDLSEPDKALRALVSAHGGKVRDISSAIRMITRL